MKELFICVILLLSLADCDKDGMQDINELPKTMKTDGTYMTNVYHHWQTLTFEGDSAIFFDSTARDTGLVNISSTEDTVYINLASDLVSFDDCMVEYASYGDTIEYRGNGHRFWSVMFYLKSSDKIVYRDTWTLGHYESEEVGFTEY